MAESDGSPGARSGRGAAGNPPNRFERVRQIWDGEVDPCREPAPITEFLEDATKGVLNVNHSPDVPFATSLNPYRGCEHGCSYCYARTYHEFLGYSAGLDFECRIMVKSHAPELLAEELGTSSWRPRTIGMCGATDCYQPVERQLRLTRRCLEVLAAFRNPVQIITKNALVIRDCDLLADLAGHDAACVALSLTTLDQDLSTRLEPRASVPGRRLAAIRSLAEAGIPVAVNLAPIIPGLNDHELPRLLEAAAAAGARSASFQVVRLPLGVAEIFERWLEHHLPTHRAKILARIRDLHGGSLDAAIASGRMGGSGLLAEQIARLFTVARRRAGLNDAWPELSTAAFRPPWGKQIDLFEND